MFRRFVATVLPYRVRGVAPAPLPADHPIDDDPSLHSISKASRFDLC